MSWGGGLLFSAAGSRADRSRFPEQRLDAVYLHDGTADQCKTARGRAPIGDLDAGVVSEIIRDLTELTS